MSHVSGSDAVAVLTSINDATERHKGSIDYNAREAWNEAIVIRYHAMPSPAPECRP